MNLVNSMDRLVEACEATTMRMPCTVHLVKQLRRELNFSDAVKSLRKQGGNLLGMSEGERGRERRGS